jgi:hypothetical protein
VRIGSTRVGPADLPFAARLLAQLIPSADREWVIGDLLEDAEDRGLRGARRDASLTCGTAAIAAGLSLHRARGWLLLPLLREVAVGLSVDRLVTSACRRAAHSFGFG